MGIQRTQKEMQERAEEDTMESVYDKDGNLLLYVGKLSEAGKKRLEENKKEKK